MLGFGHQVVGLNRAHLLCMFHSNSIFAGTQPRHDHYFALKCKMGRLSVDPGSRIRVPLTVVLEGLSQGPVCPDGIIFD